MQNNINNIPKIVEELIENKDYQQQQTKNTQPIAIKRCINNNKRMPNKHVSRSFDDAFCLKTNTGVYSASEQNKCEGYHPSREKLYYQNRNVTSFPNYLKNDDSKSSSPEDLNNTPGKHSFAFFSQTQKANSKGAGVIPYAIIDGNQYFLLQHADVPCKRKDLGWNDFGGKKNLDEEISLTAAREFSEETSCLFYLKENNTIENINLYEKLKNNLLLEYDSDTIAKLINIIPMAQKYFADKIDDSTLCVSSRDTYLSYFIRVNYISAKDIPIAEDLHISYAERYTRICKWFTFDELMNFETTDFHKRLQIAKIKNYIKLYHDKNLFI
jgi:hypothetical protein